MRTLVLLMVFCPMLSFGLDRISALSMIETGNNDRMVGRAGEISRYQILKKEWRSVTNSTRFTDPKVSEAVTRRLLERRIATFQSIYGRNPTDFEFYGLWNAPSQVYRGRVSPVVAERCRRFANLCEAANQPPQVAAVRTAPAPARTSARTLASTSTSTPTPPQVSASARTAQVAAVRPAATVAQVRPGARISPAVMGTVMLARTDVRAAAVPE